MGRLYREAKPGELAGEPMRLLTSAADIITSPDDPRLHAHTKKPRSKLPTVKKPKLDAASKRMKAAMLAMPMGSGKDFAPPPGMKWDHRLGIYVPRRGRPSIGATPGKDRSAKAKAALLEAGGRRMTLNLAPAAADDLATIARRLGTTDTAAIAHALHETAKRRRA